MKDITKELTKDKISKVVEETIASKPTKYKETRYDDGSIFIETYTITLFGGPEFAKELDDAFNAEVAKNANFGFHPVTGNPMNKDAFYKVAKEQHWTKTEIWNNIPVDTKELVNKLLIKTDNI